MIAPRAAAWRRISLLFIAATLVLPGCPSDDDDDGAAPDEADKAERTDTDDAAPDPADGDAAPAEIPADADATAREPVLPEVILPPADPVPKPPAGLPPTPAPAHNPITAEKVALGELLFFDSRLSGEGDMRCADCHDPERGFAGTERRSTTAEGRTNRRHAPSLENVAYAGAWFWDGSADSLEGAIDSHWRGQMAADPAAVAAELDDHPKYRAHFERSFGSAPYPSHIAAALAAYARTIRSGDAPWDRFERGRRGAVDEDAERGFRIFSGRGQCAVCHPPPLYTDRKFHHTGAAGPDSPPDPGRSRATGDPAERGAIRTPSLRGVAHTAPYFHDGSAETLEEAVRVMAGGGRGGRGRDLEPVQLSDDDIAALVGFLESLSPEPEPREPPAVPEP